MADQSNCDLEFRDLEPEELEMISEMYEAPSQECARVGPKGYLMPKSYKEMASGILNMELKEGDVFVASFQRSGTTWTQELVWLIANDLDYERAAAELLVNRYPFLEISMMFDITVREKIRKEYGDNEATNKMIETLSKPALDILSVMPSPRFVKSHLPMSLLPSKLLDTAKVVYVARDPRDVAVSSFHHARLFKMTKFKGSFRQMWNAFKTDLFILTPYFEHVKEAWALRNHPNMLFLFYEDLSKDLPASIRRVAEFLGKENRIIRFFFILSSEQVERLCEHLSIDNFKNNMSVNYENVRELGLLDSRENFIRKGKAGGWRYYFDDEMEQEANRWIKKNLQDTDLRFPNFEQ